MKNYDDLIDQLATDLTPTPRIPNINAVAAGWLLLSAIYVIVMIHIFGPIRDNALTQLSTQPRFLIETLTGLLAIVLMGYAAFKAAVPGALNARLAKIATGLMALWLLSYVVGLFYPALEPSMLGKRDHCFTETFIYALPPKIAAFLLVRRMYPLNPLRTALTLGLAAGMLPALYMQIACMYSPSHILLFHILPGFLVAFLGLALAASWLRWGPSSAKAQDWAG
ncbi:MAG: NrsF family protein [Halioglobus sp.]